MIHPTNRRTTSLDDALDALSHVQRRTLLVALLEPTAQSETTFTVADGTTDESESRLVEMDTVHLPKLEECGFIEWDRNSHEVWRGPRYEDIVPMLKLIEEQDENLP